MRLLLTTLIITVALNHIFSPQSVATKGGYEGYLSELNEKRPKWNKLAEEIRDLNAKLAPIHRKMKAERDRYNALPKHKQILQGPKHLAILSGLTAQAAIPARVKDVKTIQYSIINGRVKKLEAKCKTLQCDAQKHAYYVLAISGGGGGYIERALNLSPLLKGKDVSYRLANWNNLYQSKAEVTPEYPKKKAFKRFQDKVEVYFQRMPANSKLVIIGHSLGGGAALKMVDIAKKIDRRIDHLIALDPVGELGVRINAIRKYPVSGPCPPPKFTTETGKEEGSDIAYNTCKNISPKRVIPKEVKNFFHRWQENEMFPIDFGTDGKLKTAKQVRVDQKSVSYGHSEILLEYADDVQRIVEGYL